MKTLFWVSFFLFPLIGSGQEPELVLPEGHTSYPDKIIYHKNMDVVVTIGISGDNTIKGWQKKTGLLIYSVAKGAGTVYHYESRRIATVLSDKEIVLYNMTSGNEVHRFIKESATFFSPNFSPDGKSLLTFSVSNDSTWLDLYDSKTGILVYQTFCGKGRIAPWAYPSMLITPDGTTVVTTTAADPRVKLWDLKTGMLRHIFSGNRSEILTFSMSPDGSNVFSYSWRDTTGFIWNLRSKKQVAVIKPTCRLFTAFEGRFSTHNQYLVTQDQLMPEMIGVWSVVTGKKLFEFGQGPVIMGKKHYPAKVVLSPDGNTIMYNDTGMVARILDLRTGKIRFSLRDTNGTKQTAFETFYFSNNGKYIITKNIYRRFKVWDATTGRYLYPLGNGDIVSPVHFSVDEEYALVRDKYKIDIWEISSGVLTQQLNVKGHTSKITASCFSKDDSLLASSGNDFHIRIWNISNGQLRNVVYGQTAEVRSMEFHPDKTKLATGGENGARIWNTETGRLYKELPHKRWVNDIRFNSDGNVALTASTDGAIRTWNAYSGQLLLELHLESSSSSLIVNKARFSPDSKVILSASSDETARGWDAATGKKLFEIKHTGGVDDAVYYPNGTSILTSISGLYYVWNSDFTKDKMELLEEHGGTGLSFTWQFTPDGKYDIAWFRDTVWKWNRGTGALQKHYFPNGRYKMNFSNNGDWLYVAAGPELKFYSSKDFSFQYRFVAIDSAEFFTQTASGFYQCTPAAARKLHYVTKNQQIITFDQLDIKYNRPDKVLEAFGNTDSAQINSLKRAYFKRIKKLGVDTLQFSDGYSVPEADIVNRENISYNQHTQTLRIRIQATDSSYLLDRFHIWINEVPLFGFKGINILRRNSKRFDTTLTVSLSQGLNRIETSVTNVNGTESFRMPLFVKYQPATAVKPSVYFIGIGINEFADSRHNLQWCVKDIRDLALKFKQKYPGIVIDTLFNQSVTVENIQKLKQRLLNTQINDKVIIAYSGHGLLSKQYDYFLSSYNIDFLNPELHGIAYEELENLLDGIPARQKLLLLDACHSGELDKDEMAAIENDKTQSGNKGLLLNRGSSEEATGNTKTVGLQNSFELMQSLFVNVAKGTGATVIAAAGGVQFAQEWGELQNGVFTYALLEAMDRFPTMTVSQLKQYISKRVEEITKGHQRPNARSEMKETDWNIW